MPDPCGADDVVDLGVVGFPVEFGDGFGATGDQEGGVAEAAGFDLDGDGVAGDAANAVDNFFHSEAGAVAEVINEAMVSSAGRFEGLQGENVSVGEVGDVDVVADAGAVVGRVIFAEDFNGGAAAEGDVEDEGDEVRLGFVGFSAGDDTASLSTVFRGSGNVEIAERGGAQAVDLVEPVEHVLDEELGLAVGIGWLEGGGFGDRNGLRLAVDGCGGAEDQAPGAGGVNRFQQGKGGGSIVAEVNLGVFHGFAGFDEGGEVEDTIKGSVFIGGPAKKSFDLSAIRDIRFYEFDAGGDLFATGVAEIVDDDDRVTLPGEESRYCTSDITRTAGNHDFHKKITPLRLS